MKKQKANSTVQAKILYFAKSANTIRIDKLVKSENLLQPLNPQQSDISNYCNISMHFCGIEGLKLMKNVEEKCGIKLMENKTSMKKCHLWNMSFFIGLLYSIFFPLLWSCWREKLKREKVQSLGTPNHHLKHLNFDTIFDFDIAVLKLI